MKKKKVAQRVVLLACLVTALAVLILGLAACGGGEEAQQPPNEQDDQSAQAIPPSPAQSSAKNRAGSSSSGLIGTWQMTHDSGDPVPPGSRILTFSADGTMNLTGDPAVLFEIGDPGENILSVTGKYRVVDDSRLEFTPEDTGQPDTEPVIYEYSLEGDKLRWTDHLEGALEDTYQRGG